MTEATVLLKTKTSEIEALKKDNNAWYRSPIVYIVVGVIGVVVGVYVSKK